MSLYGEEVSNLSSPTDPHPTYPNPIIQEALCEIQFRQPDGSNWDPACLSQFYKEIQSDYPTFEPILQMALVLQEGPQGFQGIHPAAPQQKMRYKHSNGTRILQLGDGIFTVNLLPPYPGWKEMSGIILEAWSKVLAVINIKEISRIGLRYINRINKENADEKPLAWLEPSDYIAKSVLSSFPGFLSRSETCIENDRKVVVTFADMDEPEESYVLDIDCIATKIMGSDSSAIGAEIEHLHQIEWDVFSASKTERLDDFMCRK